MRTVTDRVGQGAAGPAASAATAAAACLAILRRRRCRIGHSRLFCARRGGGLAESFSTPACPQACHRPACHHGNGNVAEHGETRRVGPHAAGRARGPAPDARLCGGRRPLRAPGGLGAAALGGRGLGGGPDGRPMCASPGLAVPALGGGAPHWHAGLHAGECSEVAVGPSGEPVPGGAAGCQSQQSSLVPPPGLRRSAARTRCRLSAA